MNVKENQEEEKEDRSQSVATFSSSGFFSSSHLPMSSDVACVNAAVCFR